MTRIHGHGSALPPAVIAHAHGTAPEPSSNPAETIVVPNDPAIRPPHELGIASVVRMNGSSLQLPPGFLALPVWSQLCGFEDLRIIQRNYPQSFELITGAGNLSLTVGQRFAHWNGLQVGLGFAPILQDGQLALNSLDISKNIFPLSSQNIYFGKTNRVLVIDAGHGGQNVGAKCATRNVWEKDLTLDWALRIEKLLENSGWKAVLTRRDDRDISLSNRVSIADASNADLFVSLHFNSFETGAPGRDEMGLETYCVTPTGMPSHITRGYEDDLWKVYPNNSYDTANLLLATRMQASMLKATSRKDRGVRRARFMGVLREQKRPAVLLEGGFLSNPAEANLILDPAYRQQLAQAVCDALPN